MLAETSELYCVIQRRKSWWLTKVTFPLWNSLQTVLLSGSIGYYPSWGMKETQREAEVKASPVLLYQELLTHSSCMKFWCALEWILVVFCSAVIRCLGNSEEILTCCVVLVSIGDPFATAEQTQSGKSVTGWLTLQHAWDSVRYFCWSSLSHRVTVAQ